jgi:hypothetical protein
MLFDPGGAAVVDEVRPKSAMANRAARLGRVRTVELCELQRAARRIPAEPAATRTFCRPAAIFWNEAKKASISHCSAPAFVRCGAPQLGRRPDNIIPPAKHRKNKG